MDENQGQQRARDDNEQQIEDEKGPTEKLRDQDMFEADTLVPGTQKRESEEIKDEKSPNTE